MITIRMNIVKHNDNNFPSNNDSRNNSSNNNDYDNNNTYIYIYYKW